METPDNTYRSGHVTGGTVQIMTNSQQLEGVVGGAKNKEIFSIRLWLPLTPGTN